MRDSFIAHLPPGPVISPIGSEGTAVRALAGMSFGNAAWPSANLAIYTPFMLYDEFVVTRIAFRNSTSTGNIDLGIYDHNGVRLGSIGSTAIPGSNVLIGNTLSLILPPGLYYMAMAHDSTGTVSRYTGSTLQRGIIRGAYQQASAFPLPATATFATQTTSYIPSMVVSSRGFY